MDNKVSSVDYPSGGEKAVWDAGMLAPHPSVDHRDRGLEG